LPLGVRLQSTSFTEEMLEDAESLLTMAVSDGPGEELVSAEDLERPQPSYAPRTVLVPEAGGVLVATLGPVEVRGAERPIDRRRSLELVTYLALHSEGVDEGRLRSVLWPDSDPSRENFNQTVSRARQPLGHAADGSLHLPRLTDEEGARYHLGPNVAS